MLSALTLCAQRIDSRLTSLVSRPSLTTHRAQAVAPRKFDPEAVLRDISVTFNPDSTIASLSAIARMKKGVVCPTEKIEALGIKVNDVIGSLALLTVPADRLYALEGVEEIDHVEADQMNEVMTDKARQKTGVDVLGGTAADVMVGEKMVPAWEAEGLPQAYTGKGIVVGIVDTGIDFNHIAFKDQDGNSRVKLVYTGEEELKKYETAEDIAQLTTDHTGTSHGSHVAAIAAGSAVPSYTVRPVQGMAPEADLVLCGLGKSLTDSRIIKSVKTIFEYADQVQKPAVVNISLGNTYAMKDGKGSISTAIEELTLNGTKSGRVVTQSAGNDGTTPFTLDHLLLDSEKDEDGYHLRTMLANNLRMYYGGTYYAYPQGIYVYLYSLDNQEFTCDIMMVDSISGEVYPLGEKDIYYYNYFSHSFSDFPSYFRYPDIGSKNNKYYIEYKYREGPYSFINEEDKNIRLAFCVKGHDGQKIRMICNKDNTFFATPAVPGNFTAGNGENSINTASCSDVVISVGSYVARPNWQALYQWENGSDPKDNFFYTDPWMRVEGGIATHSSFGIDDNYISRPDILAPGAPILSAYNRYDLTHFFEDGALRYKFNTHVTDRVTVNGTTYFYGMQGGTSMAAPCMAGIIALWLQQDPTLSTKDVRRLLSLTADNDEFTTDVSKIPSGDLAQAAMGKVNAVDGMKMLVEKTTGIHSLAEDMENVDAPSDEWYTLQGVRLMGKPTVRGIYLKGGKKVWIE